MIRTCAGAASFGFLSVLVLYKIKRSAIIVRASADDRKPVYRSLYACSPYICRFPRNNLINSERIMKND